MSDPRTTSASLSVIEFLGTAQSGSHNGGDDSWLEGTSAAAQRLRSQITAIADEGFSVAVVCGPTGAGRVVAARQLHRASRRGGLPVALMDASDPDCPQRLDALGRRCAAGEPIGNVILTWAEQAPADTVMAISELLTGQGVELRCGAILVTAAPVATLRGASPQHSQLLARCGRSVVAVPPLAERTGDIEGLVQGFVAASVRRFGASVRGVSPQTLAALACRPWPGNVRELAGLVEQAVLSATTDWLGIEDVPGLVAQRPAPARRGELTIRMPGSSLREIELQALRLALELTDGRIVRASELLGITRHALRRKLDKHGLSDLRKAAASATPHDNDDGDAFI